MRNIKYHRYDVNIYDNYANKLEKRYANYDYSFVNSKKYIQNYWKNLKIMKKVILVKKLLYMVIQYLQISLSIIMEKLNLLICEKIRR